METPIGDDEDSHLGDFIEDTQRHGADRGHLFIHPLRDRHQNVLDSLTPREARSCACASAST